MKIHYILILALSVAFLFNNCLRKDNGNEKRSVDSISNLTGSGNLEFYETYDNVEIIGVLSQADKLLKDSLIASGKANTNPLLGILNPMLTQSGDTIPSCIIGLVDKKDTASVSRYLEMPGVKKLFPKDIRFAWSRFPYKYDKTGKMFELHALRITSLGGKAPVDGSMIASAAIVREGSDSDIKIQLTMNNEGAGKFAALTKENINRCIAVVLNGYVRSYPRVQAEITGGKLQISGDFSREEANDLLSVFNAGQ